MQGLIDLLILLTFMLIAAYLLKSEIERIEGRTIYHIGTLTKAHPSDSGWDLYSTQDLVIEPMDTAKVATGVCLGLPKSYEAQVRPRSSMSSKGILGHFGTVDNKYRGEVMVCLTNLSGLPYHIAKGDRIAQLVFASLAPSTLHQIEAIKP